MSSGSDRDYRVPLDPQPTPLGVRSGDVIVSLASYTSSIGPFDQPSVLVAAGDVLIVLSVDGQDAELMTRDGRHRFLHLTNKTFRILCKSAQDDV